MSKSFIPYLQHILDECHYITSVITDDIQMYQFLSDETLKRAITRSLSIIGEATKKIPADIKYQWRSISWREMAGMRDKLVHDYMGINYLIVWDVTKNISLVASEILLRTFLNLHHAVANGRSTVANIHQTVANVRSQLCDRDFSTI